MKTKIILLIGSLLLFSSFSNVTDKETNNGNTSIWDCIVSASTASIAESEIYGGTDEETDASFNKYLTDCIDNNDLDNNPDWEY